MGWKSPVEGLEASMVQPRGTKLVLLSALGPSMGGRSPQQPPQVESNAGSFPIPGTLDLSSPWPALVYRVSWGCQWAWFPDSDDSPPQEGPLP